MNLRTYRGFGSTALLVCAATVAAATIQKEPAPKPPASEPQTQKTPEIDVDPKWLERIPKDDRAALEPLLGYAPPAFTTDLKWPGGDAATWEALRGKVIVVQSFTTANPVGRKWPGRAAQALSEFTAKDVQMFALHTPDQADSAEAFIAKQPLPKDMQLIVDPSGEFCDSLGIFKQPVNVVVDRNGTLRYAGLNTEGLQQAVASLVAEPFDPKASPTQLPQAAQEAKAAEFPEPKGSVGSATDLRGKKAPEFIAKEWLTKQPNPGGKVVVVDFWATWCGPCVAAIPHMNDLATKFGNDAVFIGLSNEKADDFAKGMKKANLEPENFKYALALDPTGAMIKAINAQTIPYCLVMSKDWVVRWQGNPTRLDEATLEQIIRADQAAGQAGQSSRSRGAKKRGWAGQPR